MAKFLVTFKVEVLSSLLVEADDEESAKETAFELHTIEEGTNSIFVNSSDDKKRRITYTGEILGYDEDTMVEEVSDDYD